MENTETRDVMVHVCQKEVSIKTEKTEITHTQEAISVRAPEINLESDKLHHRSLSKDD